MISTDRNILVEGSAVRARQIEYAKQFEEVHIIVFTSKGNLPSEMVISPNCYTYPTNSFFKILSPFSAISLGRFIASRRKITHITCQDPFLTGLAGVSLKKQLGLVLEIQLHTDIGSPHFTYTVGNRIRKMLALQYLPKADGIRVVSNKIKEYLVNNLGISVSKIEVRPVPIDVENIKNAHIIHGADLHKKYVQFEKVVLMASRLEPEKNIKLALDAWVTVIKEMPKAGLVIVGSGSQFLPLASYIKKQGIENSVVIEKWIDQDVLYSYYKTIDIFLNTSLFEGYGMTLVEARAGGCKVISTDVGVAKEVGATIVDYSAESVAQAIVTVLKS